ncbi:MAG: hypothetical protein J6J74_07700 [Elusimicrobiaceae bacterium]|nr:hypothetical protein [Elusimicrobiaceae bacterium]
MKRLFIFSLLLLSSAAYAKTKNKISMVTYFPVPYVAYSQVNTTEQMDIGLTSACSMKLGCSEESATLNATRVNLKGGKLNLDGGRGIKGYTLSLGSGSGEGKISFQNVRIQTGNMESVNAQDMKVSALELFGKTFPSCKEKDSSGQMKWASLTLKGASSNELYLMCGDFAASTCKPTHNGWETYRDACPEGQTGYIEFRWNYTSCKYQEMRSCKAEETLKRCLTKVMYCDGVEVDLGFVLDGATCGGIRPPGGSDRDSCSLYQNRGQEMNPYVISNTVGGVNVYNKYQTIASTRCTPGTECRNCKLGQKYVVDDVAFGACCYSLRSGVEKALQLYVVPYAMCKEMADCSEGGSQTSCSKWSDTFRSPY